MGCCCRGNLTNATAYFSPENEENEEKEENEENEEKEDDEPLIKNYHENYEISNNSKDNIILKGKKKNWNDNDPNLGLTNKQTMYVTDNNNNNHGYEKSKFQTTEQKNNVPQSDMNHSFGSNIEIFGKIKTINDEEEGNNAFLVKSSKTLLEFAYKKIDISDKNQDAIQQILKEAEMIKNINHPNIVKIFEANISKDYKYIELLTEFPEDGDLQMKLDEYECDFIQFKENQLLDWLNQVCFALKTLHSQKILHRNIKPSSIYLMKAGFTKLGDFGLGKIITKNGDLKRVKTIMNKIQFTAPEIFEKNNFTEKTDIWFLGVTFFQLMTYKFPFKGDNDKEKMESILNENKNYYNFSYSDNLKDLISKMISKNPDNRPTPDEILDMPFIRKRMESYINENENKFLKAQKTLNIFANLEEIQTVDKNIGEEQTENKKEIIIIDNNDDLFGNLEEIQTVGDNEVGHNENKKESKFIDNNDNIFGNLEEIQTVGDNEEGQNANKKEAKFIDNNDDIFGNLEEIKTVGDHEEEPKEKIIDINSNIEKILEEKEDIKDNNKENIKENNSFKSVPHKEVKKKEKRVHFNFNEEEIIKKKKENADKKAKKNANEFVRHLTIIKDLINK